MLRAVLTRATAATTRFVLIPTICLSARRPTTFEIASKRAVMSVVCGARLANMGIHFRAIMFVWSKGRTASKSASVVSALDYDIKLG